MSYTMVGSCPKCGAPVYSSSNWMSITPPPSTPSCNCDPSSYKIITTGVKINFENLPTFNDYYQETDEDKKISELESETQFLRGEIDRLVGALEAIDSYNCELCSFWAAEALAEHRKRMGRE